jgi:hypothetical protein
LLLRSAEGKPSFASISPTTDSRSARAWWGFSPFEDGSSRQWPADASTSRVFRVGRPDLVESVRDGLRSWDEVDLRLWRGGSAG